METSYALAKTATLTMLLGVRAESATEPMCMRHAPSPSRHQTVRDGCASAIPCAMGHTTLKGTRGREQGL